MMFFIKNKLKLSLLSIFAFFSLVGAKNVTIVIHGYPGSDKARQFIPFCRDFAGSFFGSFLCSTPEVKLLSKQEIIKDNSAKELSCRRYGHTPFEASGSRYNEWFFSNVTYFSGNEDKLRWVAFQLVKQIYEKILSVPPKDPISIELVGSSLGGLISAYIVEIFAILKALDISQEVQEGTRIRRMFSRDNQEHFDDKLLDLVKKDKNEPWIQSLKSLITGDKVVFSNIFSIGTPVSKDRFKLISSNHWGEMIQGKYFHIFSLGDSVQKMDKWGLAYYKLNSGTNQCYDPSTRPSHNKLIQINLEIAAEQIQTENQIVKTITPEHDVYITFNGHWVEYITLIKEKISNLTSQHSFFRIVVPQSKGAELGQKKLISFNEGAIVSLAPYGLEKAKEIFNSAAPENHFVAVDARIIPPFFAVSIASSIYVYRARKRLKATIWIQKRFEKSKEFLKKVDWDFYKDIYAEFKTLLKKLNPTTEEQTIAKSVLRLKIKTK